jgi:tryptophan synthase alpha chain
VKSGQSQLGGNSEQRIANSEHPPANAEHPTPKSQQPTANSQHPTANSQHPTANGQQPTANRIDRRFAALKGQAALILYVTAGHPDLATSRWLTPVVAQMADILEIGIPFSDPVADGPIIQESTQAALRHGVTLDNCFEIARTTREATETPIVFLAYYNPVLHYGLERFAAACQGVGVDGVICADLPAEEAGPLHEALTAKAVHLIPMVAPTSTDARIAQAARNGSGFIYCVSRTGVTGLREDLSDDLSEFLARVRRHTSLPRAVGFGVSNAEHAARVSRQAEGVIIGSALVDLIGKTLPQAVESKVAEFVAVIREGMRGDG